MHDFAQHIKDLTDIIVALHALAIVIVNITTTPKTGSNPDAVHKGYRFIEMLAGLITPLAKR
jgi:hypothetical protein